MQETDAILPVVQTGTAILQFMRKIHLLPLLLFLFTSAKAQNNPLSAGVEVQTIFTSDQVPFWMRSNQFGSVPLAGVSTSLIGSAARHYDTSRKRLFDWGFGFEGRVNAGKRVDFLLIEGYAKLRASMLELKAGRSKDIIGLVDTSLSSGSIAVSGNALGVPKIQLAIPEFYSLPIFGNLFSIKGNFAHGWIGDVPIQYTVNNATHAETYFHQSSVYGRLGKPAWRLKLFAGVTHQVFWGSDSSIFGSQFPHSDWYAFPYVVTGKKFLGVRDISKVGNHLGSIDIGAQFTTDKLIFFVYRQNFYDKGAIWYGANIADGLNGVSITKKIATGKKVQWNKMLVEVLYSKNQGANQWTPSGPEYYYNHEVYTEGYSYKTLSLGTPFFSTRADTKKDLPYNPREYFINDRVFLVHFGINGSVKQWDVTSKISYSKNYGTYHTGEARMLYTINGLQYYHIPVHGIFPETNQLSAFLEVGKKLRNGLHVGFVTAIDIGELYPNSLGALLKLSKSF